MKEPNTLNESISSNKEKRIVQGPNAGAGIRTPELLREWILSPSPLTWLGNPRQPPSHFYLFIVFGKPGVINKSLPSKG